MDINCTSTCQDYNNYDLVKGVKSIHVTQLVITRRRQNFRKAHVGNKHGWEKKGF